MRICILKPSKGEYSETFIARQIMFLKPQVVLYEGWYPTCDDYNDKSFLPFPFNFKLFRGSFRNLFPKAYHNYFTRKFSKFLKEKNIDVVLANYGLMGSSCVDSCTLAGIPIIVHFHGFDAHHHITLKKQMSSYKKMFRLGVEIICVSVDMKKQLEILGAKNVWLNPCTVDSELFSAVSPLTSEKKFIFVGRFTAKKNPLLLINSMQKVTEHFPNAKLVMIGDGALLKQAQKLTKELRLEKNVEFRGSRSPAEVSDALKDALAFVQHSLTAEDGDKEGTPNTILEASSSALPVISTAHAGIKEAVIHGETGYLVDEGDWEGMADYMIKLANNHELATEMGKNGREHIIRNYNIKNQIEVFHKAFAEAVKKQK